MARTDAITITAERPHLTFSKIVALWLPLAASMAFMTAENPIVNAGIARTAQPEIHLAAFGIAFSLAVTMESPVIMLLATSTALSRDLVAYRLIRRFALYAGVALSGFSLFVAFTPLYAWLVPGLMGIPPEIAAAARPAFQILSLWNLPIAWRRSYQGLLIRVGRTQWIGLGTMLRLTTSGSVVLLGALLTSLPGAVIGASALLAATTVEALFITFVAQRAAVPRLKPVASESLTYRRLIAFHTPLAMTSLMTWLVQPIISAGLARAVEPKQSLATWPVTYGLIVLLSSFSMALHEAVIALADSDENRATLRRFVVTVGVGMAALLGLIAFTPLIQIYFERIIGLPPTLREVAVPAVRLGILAPLLFAGQSWLRGLLVRSGRTERVRWGMGVNLAVLGLTMAIGVWHGGIIGTQLAAIAFSAAVASEVLFLLRRSKCRQRRDSASLCRLL